MRNVRPVRLFGSQGEVIGQLRVLTLIHLASALLGTHVPEVNEVVRVHLFSSHVITSAEFQAEGDENLRILEGEEVVGSVASNEPVTVEIWQGMLRVRWSRGSIPLAKCRLEGPALTRVSADGKDPRTYRGSFEVTLQEQGGGRIKIVNTLATEHYVASVLPSEYPFSEDEGAKAQAVVIRTYAASAMGRNGSEYALRDDVGSQVYLGYTAETDLSRRLALETAGSIILHDGQTIDAVYSSHCGGHTANNEDIWGTEPVPYLRGKKDPFDQHAPVASWQNEADQNAIRERLSRHFGREVRSVSVSDRGKGDHVRQVRLNFDEGEDETMTGEHFRGLVNRIMGESLIPSSVFEIKKKGRQYRFVGKGNGHGVGLCQWGAAEQARSGRDFRDIIRFYYRDVEITDSESADWLVAAQLTDDSEEVSPSNDRPEGAADPGETEPKSGWTRRPGW
jgi:stage II sporulation protein D